MGFPKRATIDWSLKDEQEKTWQRAEGKDTHVKGNSTCQGLVVGGDVGIWELSGTGYSGWSTKNKEEHGVPWGHLTP